MKRKIDYELNKGLKSIGIDSEVGFILDIYDDKKMQQLALIWLSVNHIVENCNVNLSASRLIDGIMIDGKMIENTLVRYKGKWLNPDDTEIRASLKLQDNTRQSYNRIIELIKEYHKENFIDDFHEFWKDQQGV
ncbi:MAG: hypothetical protein ACRC0A_00925 [Chitinophagaceae bacterium]